MSRQSYIASNAGRIDQRVQAQHLDAIGEEFPGMVRGVLPLHDDEIRGVGELRAIADELFGQRVAR